MGGGRLLVYRLPPSNFSPAVENIKHKAGASSNRDNSFSCPVNSPGTTHERIARARMERSSRQLARTA